MRFKQPLQNYNAQNIAMQETRHIHAQTLVGEAMQIALDEALPSQYQSMVSCGYQSFSNFLGYSFLEQISQNALISSGVETIADEMTRNFCKVVYTGTEKEGEDPQTEEKVKQLEVDIKKFKIKELFRSAAEMIGYYGGCLMYFNHGIKEKDLATPLYLDSVTFKQGSLKNFVVIDPINVTPGNYNTQDPTKEDYFKPSTWWVLGKEIHISRLLYFCGKEAPLLLKPAYNFFGVSAAQLAWDYVENFNSNRESVSRLLNNFSTTVLKSNLEDALMGEGTSSIDSRVEYFIKKQNNSGVFLLDKEQEDLMKVDSSLAGTTDIARQALELIASVFRIPAVKFLGISPSGFNATGESDIRNFYDYIQSLQQKQLAENMEKVLQILQLNTFGEIDHGYEVEWLPLGKEDANLKAQTEKTKADTIAVYLDRNVLSPEEARKGLAEDKEGEFSFIDPDAEIESEEAGFGSLFGMENDDVESVDKAGAVYGNN